MMKSANTLLKIICILLFVSVSLSYSFNGTLLTIFDHLALYLGYAVTDLEKNDTNFAYDAQLWNISVPVTALMYTVCSGTYLLGGYGVLGVPGSPAKGQFLQREYTLLPTHTMIYFSLSLWVIDTWDGNLGDLFQIQFDQRIMSGLVFNMLDFPNSGNLCGVPGAKDLGEVRLFGRAYHTGNTLSLIFISLLDQWAQDESFGIRDLNLLFVNTPVTTTESLCGLGPANLTANQCRCPEGQYENPAGSGTCVACPIECQSCFGGTYGHCYQCANDMYFNGYFCLNCQDLCATCAAEGVNQCITCKPGNFMINTGLGKGTCVDECLPPLVLSYTATTGLCAPPPGCTSNYLYWDGTCLATCNYPLISESLANILLCKYPCGLGEYLYWNGSCHATCPSPLSATTSQSVNYCNPACGGTQFVLEDGTCSSSCLFPLVQQLQSTGVTGKIAEYCISPCTKQQYLYANGSCLNTCPPPLTQRLDNIGKMYCDFGCSLTPATPYLAWNGNCQFVCSFPQVYQVTTIGTFCISPCNQQYQYYHEETGTCDNICNMYSMEDPSGLFMWCLSDGPVPAIDNTILNPILVAPARPNIVSFVALAKPIYYIRYLNINYPARLQSLILNLGRSPTSIRFPQFLQPKSQSKFTSHTLPDPFQSVNLHSSFLVNFFPEFTTWSVAIFCALLFYGLEKLASLTSHTQIESILERFRVILGCNFFLILVATGMSDVILYSSLQMRTIRADNFYDLISIGFCLIIIGITIVTIFRTLDIIARIRDAKIEAVIKRNPEIRTNSLIEWQNYEVAFRSYTDHNDMNRYFFILYTARLALPMVIASFIYYFPVVQVFLQLIGSLWIIAYIVFRRPIQSAINHAQLLAFEILVLIINILILALTIMEVNGNADQDSLDLIGDFIFLTNAGINLLWAGFLIVKLVLGIQDAVYLWKESHHAAVTALLQLLFLPLQQGGMGFESAQVAGAVSYEKAICIRALANKKQERLRKAIEDEDKEVKYFHGLEDEIELFAELVSKSATHDVRAHEFTAVDNIFPGVKNNTNTNTPDYSPDLLQPMSSNSLMPNTRKKFDGLYDTNSPDVQKPFQGPDIKFSGALARQDSDIHSDLGQSYDKFRRGVQPHANVSSFEIGVEASRHHNIIPTITPPTFKAADGHVRGAAEDGIDLRSTFRSDRALLNDGERTNRQGEEDNPDEAMNSQRRSGRRSMEEVEDIPNRSGRKKAIFEHMANIKAKEKSRRDEL